MDGQTILNMTAYLTNMVHVGIPVKNAAFTPYYEKLVTCPATQSTTPATPATDKATHTLKAALPQTVTFFYVFLYALAAVLI